MLSAALLCLFALAQGAILQSEEYSNSPQVSWMDEVKVPVVLGVMSRCPDAILCESVWDTVLQQVGNKVDISLSFIGRLNPLDKTYGVDCMHGMQECAGNVYELCVAKYHPTEWWAFLQCQNFQGTSQIGLTDTAEKCAGIAGFEWTNDAAHKCAGDNGQGEEGVQLLQRSVRASMHLGIKKSCTILVNGQQVCIHDGIWRDCKGGHTPADFIKLINEEYQRLNSAN